MANVGGSGAEDFMTARLRVENWQPTLKSASSREGLTDELTSILTPDVMRHLPEALHIEQKRGAIVQWMSDRNAEAEVLTVRDRTHSTLLGLLILAEIPDNDGSRFLHLGYLFAEAAWGQGYATEMVTGLVEHLKSQKRVARILGGVGKGNAASARVLEKAGFKKSELLSNDSTDIFCEGVFVARMPVCPQSWPKRFADISCFSYVRAIRP